MGGRGIKGERAMAVTIFLTYNKYLHKISLYSTIPCTMDIYNKNFKIQKIKFRHVNYKAHNAMFVLLKGKQKQFCIFRRH